VVGHSARELSGTLPATYGSSMLDKFGVHPTTLPGRLGPMKAGGPEDTGFDNS
jgi:hypothetical protein